MKSGISNIVTSLGRNGSAIALNRESLVKIQRGPATVSEEAFLACHILFGEGAKGNTRSQETCLSLNANKPTRHREVLCTAKSNVWHFVEHCLHTPCIEGLFL